MTIQKAKDFSYFLSEQSKRRKPSPLKEAFKDSRKPGVISLGGGLPMPEFFPYEDLEAKTRVPPFTGGPSETISADKNVKLSIKKSYEDPDAVDDIPLSISLQYGLTEGNIKLRNFILEHTKLIHNIKYEDWDVILSCGNTNAWDAVLRTFTNTGDTILAEEFTFSSSLETASAHGLKVLPVAMDLEGIIPEKLDEQLTNWTGDKPKLLYTIPTGQNPTGSTLSNERRAAVYRVAQKHDFLIVEDEPYFFLQMSKFTKDLKEREKDENHVSHQEFTNGLVKSFLDFDTEGRVFRLDSFSKVIAPGTRIGWIVGQKRLLERFVRLNETSIQTPSGFSQSLVHGVLNRWGQEGYLDWLISLRKAYSERRDVCVDALEKYMPKEVVEYIPPTAGMFFWIKVDATKHPRFKEYNSDAAALEDYLYKKVLDDGVLIIPGHWFSVKKPTETDKTDDSMYFRGALCSVGLKQLEAAIEKVSVSLKKEYEL